MSRAEIAAAVIRGTAMRAVREADRAAAEEAKRIRDEQRRREWPARIAMLREHILDPGTSWNLYRFIEEAEARGAIDMVMAPGDPVIEFLIGPRDAWLEYPTFEELLAAFAGIDGARARLLGVAIEIAWDREA